MQVSYTNIAVTGAKIKCCPHVPGLQKGARGCTCRHTVKLDTSTSQAMDEYPIEIFESLLSLGSYNVSCSSPKSKLLIMVKKCIYLTPMTLVFIFQE